MTKCPKGCEISITGAETDLSPIHAQGSGVLAKAANIHIGELGLVIEDADEYICLHPKFKANPLLTSLSKDFCFSLIITNTRAEVQVVPVNKQDNFEKDLSSDKLDIVKFSKTECGLTDGVDIKVVAILPPFPGTLSADRSWAINCSKPK